MTDTQGSLWLRRPPVEMAGRLEFNPGHVAVGLVLDDPAVVLELFRDGRRAQPIIEARLVQAFGPNGWRAVATVGGGRRLETVQNGVRTFYDVRVMVESLSFAPSWMKGQGRRFDPVAFELHYQENVSGAFVCDVSEWPSCPYWRVGSTVILDWGREGRLGARGSVSREDLPGLLEGFQAMRARARKVKRDRVLHRGVPMGELCEACGETWASHGGLHPHTIHPKCEGFASKTERCDCPERGA